MQDVALIFPGQGAQFVGMGQEFYENSPEAQQIIDEADQVMDNGLKNTMFNGPAEKLTSTAYCQPGIFTYSFAALKAFMAHPKFQNVNPRYTAGLSLGEYTALAASEVLPFEDTLRLVERRSFFMEEATKASQGKMAAIIGADREKLDAVCKETGAEVANYNSPQQIVITGYAERVDAAVEKIREIGAKSIIPLEVGGAFHSSLMQPAADQFEKTLDEVVMACPEIPMISNVNGQPAPDPGQIRDNLAKQITSSVRWVDSVELMIEEGVQDFIEIGPGKVLTGLIKRTSREVSTYNIQTPADIEKLPF